MALFLSSGNVKLWPDVLLKKAVAVVAALGIGGRSVQAMQKGRAKQGQPTDFFKVIHYICPLMAEQNLLAKAKCEDVALCL